ncbi:MAG: chromophore lyase CpcT/CpeT [Candidatus Eisenbacteria bacterium]|uniref:Chromophore lyase CpcT/CpeT n=1 Tax=Eiseniibacteriota bacterium TaxID=2212470 RepID=A0A938BNL5_UNCEI|nr:chromophore lyase CpcT/CpeT [Candidatus Eisenbacteria bacterium]
MGITSLRAGAAILSSALLLCGCGSNPGIAGGRLHEPAGATGAVEKDAQLEAVCAWMTGCFSSAEQAAADTSFFDVRLRMAPIWSGRGDGCWLYVEQAIAGSEHKPYRQRVYHLTRAGAGAVASAVHELAAPLRFVGAWRDPAILDGLAPDSLHAREGCVIYLEWEPPGRFTGATRGRECLSSLRGASYAVSEVVLTPGAITTWDRGYDDAGRQVWGAERGGYIFRKISSDPRAE